MKGSKLSNIIDVPAYKGSYILLIQLDKDYVIEIGRLGSFDFQSGWYLYAGSAQGSGGVRARLRRHLRVDKSRHWHIDWLLRYAKIARAYYYIDTKNKECIWSHAIANCLDITVPVNKFGASDCSSKCPAHLFRIATNTKMNVVDNIIQTCISEQLAFIDV